MSLSSGSDISANDSTPNGPTYDEIAIAAYHLYLRRGAADGRDFDDWLEAEQELRTRGSS